ncbi:hypothetical protein [Nocardia paucivorans]|uniref:hypothetical protein n=1 Tax=Nocardia paucivorans TaxID=114259 RepID=UPI000317A334|nr:hypothetical protein [Nocardia paucivorans]
MAQRRPLPPPPDQTPTPAALHVTRGGWRYSVSGDAVDTLEAALRISGSTGAAELARLSDEVPLARVWAEIGWRGVQAAAADAGFPRSRSTIYAWMRRTRAGKRGFHPRIGELMQRRALVARRGGVEELAAALGVSASAVSRWQTGHTEAFRGAAGHALDRVRLVDARERAALPPIRGALVRITASIEYRDAGDAYQELGREHRSAALNLDAGGAGELAAALHAGDHAAAAMLVEDAWTQEWGTFGSYSDAEGVHLVEVERIDITWT